MTVKELRDMLVGLPDDMDVVMSKDGEGNSYSPLSDCNSNCIYIPDSTWSGDVVYMYHGAEGVGMDQEEWEHFIKVNKRSLVLCPVN